MSGALDALRGWVAELTVLNRAGQFLAGLRCVGLYKLIPINTLITPPLLLTLTTIPHFTTHHTPHPIPLQPIPLMTLPTKPHPEPVTILNPTHLTLPTVLVHPIPAFAVLTLATVVRALLAVGLGAGGAL